MSPVFLIQLAAALAMTGLIWFVQVVHYPLFGLVGGDYQAYQAEHMRRVTLVVGPLMLAEAATAVWLVAEPQVLSKSAAWLNLALLAAIWVSTAVLQVPQHERLTSGFDARAHELLVGTNWLRTVLWSVRSALLLRAASIMAEN